MKGDLAENPLNSLPVVHGRGGDLSLPLSSLFLCFPRDVWDWRWRRAGAGGIWDGMAGAQAIRIEGYAKLTASSRRNSGTSFMGDDGGRGDRP